MKPNIIIFNPDQMRADSLAHLGNSAAMTPNLDRFARLDAVSFRNAFCQNPVCVPSRCSFLTGLYPHVRGHRTQSYMLHPEESSLLEELKNAGYYVWMNRRNDFLPAQYVGIFEQHCSEFFQGSECKPNPGPENPNPRGEPGDKNYYSFYNGRLKLDEDGKNYNSDDEAVDKAIELIRNPPKDQPFCVFLGLFYPHPPYQIEEPYFSAIDSKKLPPRIPAPEDLANRPRMLQLLHQNIGMDDYTEEDWNRLRTCYLGMCMKIDVMFGRLCAALREEGLYDDTAIFFFSDHGDFAGDYGLPCKAQNLMQDSLVKVPLLIKPHKGIPVSPGITDSLTELVDFYATAMDFADVEPDHTHFGRSLRPVLADRSTINRTFVCSEGGRTKDEVLQCSETRGSGLPQEALFWPRMTAQLDDIAHTKATMIRTKDYKFVLRLYEEDEFYDLRKDASESRNEIHNPLYADVIIGMKQQLLEWYQGTCDIVPKKPDVSVTIDMMLERAKKQLAPEQFEEFSAEIRKLGNNIPQLIGLFEKYNARVLV